LDSSKYIKGQKSDENEDPSDTAQGNGLSVGTERVLIGHLVPEEPPLDIARLRRTFCQRKRCSFGVPEKNGDTSLRDMSPEGD
jgi:hypothetical protein